MINGPYNLVRLEGKIGAIKKTFYLFMDKHMPPHLQSECPVLRSTHIRNYLIDEFDKLKKTNKKVDFFLEEFPDVSGDLLKISGIYLDQMRNMFERIFKFDFKKNKVTHSSEFPNVRFHYMDIRPYFTFKVANPFGIYYEIGDFIYGLPKGKMKSEDVNTIKNGLDIFHSQLKIIYDVLFSKPQEVIKTPIIRKFKNVINYDKDEGTNAIKYLVNKMRFLYKNKNVQDELNNIIETDMHGLFDQFSKIVDHLYEKLNSSPTSEQILEIYQQYENIVLNIFCLIIDIYFLRRSLDKDYISTIIAYTGGLHTSNYLKYLIGKFDFKITHVFYSNISSISTLNKKISSLQNPFEILDLFMPEEKDFYQCVDVSNFPKNFA